MKNKEEDSTMHGGQQMCKKGKRMYTLKREGTSWMMVHIEFDSSTGQAFPP